QYLFRKAVGIDIGGVEHGDPGIETNADKPCRFIGAGRTPGFEEFIAAAESAGAHAERRHLEPGSAESSEFHDASPLESRPAMMQALTAVASEKCGWMLSR